MKFKEMDRHVTLGEQMRRDAGPVILVNTFTVEPEEADMLKEASADDAAFFKAQPGFISTQLHRGIGGSCVFLNYAVWESVDHFRTAFGKPEFTSKLTRYPASTETSPHLFQRLAIPGVCVG